MDTAIWMITVILAIIVVELAVLIKSLETHFKAPSSPSNSDRTPQGSNTDSTAEGVPTGGVLWLDDPREKSNEDIMSGGE